MSSLQTYYFTYVIGDLNKLSVANTFSLASIVVMPLYPAFMKKFGKRRVAIACFAAGMVCSVIPLAMPLNYIVWGIVNTIRTICYGSINVMPALYTIDCMRYTELKDGVKVEGIMASVVSVAQKVGAALSLFLSGVVLQMAGYDGSLAVQSESAIAAIKALFLVFPIFVMLVGTVSMYFWKVEKELAVMETGAQQ